jgi:hypothetical protein
MFASMLEAADFVLVMAYPDEATSPAAGSRRNGHAEPSKQDLWHR